MSFGITASSYTNGGGGGGNSAYAQQVLADSPLLYLKLNETSGTVAVDSSGNGRDGTYVNGPVLNQRGLVQADTDTCVLFEATAGSHVTLPSSGWMNVTSMTITAICRITLSGIQMLASRYHDPDGDRSWFLYVQNGEFKFYARDNGGGETIVASGITGAVGQEYYVAAYADASGVGIRVYDYTGLLGAATGTGRAVNSSTRAFKVARSDDGASYQADAYIDEIAFYGAALSTSRLDALASLAMTRQPQWLNRASGASPRNGTTGHTITFPATSAGSLMVVALNCPTLFTVTTPGWTQRHVAVNGTELELLTRSVNTGETSLQLTTNLANCPVNYLVYEFPSGTAYHSGAIMNSGAVWPTLSGLPGTPVTVFAIWSSLVDSPAHLPLSSQWLFGWKEDFDLMTVDDGTTDGVYMTAAYLDLCTDTTVPIQWNTHMSVANVSNSPQLIVVAFTVP